MDADACLRMGEFPGDEDPRCMWSGSTSLTNHFHHIAPIP